MLLGALGDTTAEDVPLQQLKKRTFLQKLSLKASWPAKRKPKPGKVMTPDDFKETYLWHSPSCTGSSSEQEAGSSSSSDGKSSVTVEASPPPPQELTLPAVSVTVSSVVTESEPPPPPAPVETQVPPPVQTLPASTTATELSLKQMSESMSVTTSEDSGCIVARPSSSASKTDSLLSSRPDSSSSFKLFAPRTVSPAPSDMSHRFLCKIDEAPPRPEPPAPPSQQEPKQDLPNSQSTKAESTVKSGRQPRAWYDLSDDEPDLLSSTPLRRSSSDEEHHCA
ncbi:hypothetical protein B566_EDAN018319 [Ephemera danica]|nr:hypothetical protein B566_EDAN018319 [Ephemera danica]